MEECEQHNDGERGKKNCNLCASDDIIGLNLLCRHRAFLANASRRRAVPSMLSFFDGPFFALCFVL